MRYQALKSYTRMTFFMFTVVVLTGCWEGRTTRAVAFVGDSLMQGALVDIALTVHAQRANAPLMVTNALGATPLCVIDHIEQRIDSGFDLVQGLDTIVVHLGTNDLLWDAWFGAACVSKLEANLNRFMSKVASRSPDTKVLWIAPHTWIPNIAPVREEIFAAADRWANMEIVLFEPELYHLTSDMVHLTQEASPGQISGNALFAQAIGTAVFGDVYE